MCMNDELCSDWIAPELCVEKFVEDGETATEPLELSVSVDY